jgi:membrane associated rhomboid family serine protease
MIPLRDVIPSRSVPFAALALIGATGVVWLAEVFLVRDAAPALLGRWGVVPADVRAPSLVISLFLHGSWLHTVGNLWALWIFGDNVEGRLGHARFLVFYLACGCVAALAHVATDRASTLPHVGAGGAVAGVLGAYFVAFPRSRVLALVPVPFFLDIVEVPASPVIGIWLVTQVFETGAIAREAGAAGGTAPIALTAGFAAGAACIFLFKKLGRPYPRWA